ncbi:MAG: hypothetical protein RL277_1642 [Planctomycetota bacterium]|jgi:phosphonate transport system permease protein
MTSRALEPAPHRWRSRLGLFVLLGFSGLGALLLLEAPFSALLPQAGGLRIVREFFAAMLEPALEYESPVPAGTPSILSAALAGARRTLVFAAAGMSLALVLGVTLGFLGSSAWWDEERHTRSAAGLRRAVWLAARVLITLMRSVHELLWAVLFLAAFGLNTFGAVIAIAIPYGGTLAKIFSELLEEAPRASARALAQLGAGSVQQFIFGLVPRALPDMSAYAFYRFECAVRSSAVLGFFGFPTLGYSIAQAFENLHYRELWTYLYCLIALVLLLELWSASLRRRFIA